MTLDTTLTALLTYIGQMLWLISAQLHTLAGGGEFPVPDAQAVAGLASAWPDPAELIARLKGGAAHAD